MKLFALISVIFILSIPLVLAQWSENPERGEGTISVPVIENQWVLIGMNTDIPGGLSSTSEVNLADIKAGWLWDPEKQDYAVHIANGKNGLEAAPTGNAGFWVLPSKSGNLEFKVDLEISKDSKIIDRVNLENGFNFVYILPSMSGRSMAELGRNCKLVAMYAFIPELQQWTPLPLDTPAPPQAIGRSILVENSGTCSLTSELPEPSTTVEPTPSPPQLPAKTTPEPTGCPDTGLVCSVDCLEEGELEDGTPCENGVLNEETCECEAVAQPQTTQPTPTQTTTQTQSATPSPTPTSTLKQSGEVCSQNSECQSQYCTFGSPRVCS